MNPQCLQWNSQSLYKPNLDQIPAMGTQLTMELVAIINHWSRRRQFSLRVYPMVSLSWPSGRPHIQENQVSTNWSSCVKNNKKGRKKRKDKKSAKNHKAGWAGMQDGSRNSPRSGRKYDQNSTYEDLSWTNNFKRLLKTHPKECQVTSIILIFWFWFLNKTSNFGSKLFKWMTTAQSKEFGNIQFGNILKVLNIGAREKTISSDAFSLIY